MRKFLKYFICLKSGHLVKTATKRKQRNHVFICTKGENKNENGFVTHVGVSRSILIQTLKKEIFNIESDKKLTRHLLLDSGSQRNYATDN